MAYRWLGVWLLCVACAAGCDASAAGDPRSDGGAGGSVGEGGTGGGGAGGDGGTDASTGGSGGTVLATVECDTSPLCLSCPFESEVCEDADDCSIGYTCIDSGCTLREGGAVRVCTFAGGGACESEGDCSADRDCVDVPGQGLRCVKMTPGCSTDSDCVNGFNCEDGVCFDRRVPCILDEDCPKSHYCERFSSTGFCERINQGCDFDFQCAGLGPHCVDVDDDGRSECAGVFNPNAAPSVACLNDECGGATPVCEVAATGFTDCGQYGLCTGSGDCADGFECVALWLDGRSECVPMGGSCSRITDCPERQVCASPRSGGAPSCQTGYQP